MGLGCFHSAVGAELARLSIEGVTVSALTGLPDEPPPMVIPIQLTLPCFVA